MIKVENENVEVRGISLDVIGEFQALCDHLNKELGEKDFAFVLETMEGKFYKKRISELKRQLEEKDKRIRKLNIEAQRYYEDAYCNRQDIMQVADKSIRLLAKALELACANHPAVCDEAMDCSKGVDCVGCLVEHYKTQARKELENEEC